MVLQQVSPSMASAQRSNKRQSEEHDENSSSRNKKSRAAKDRDKENDDAPDGTSPVDRILNSTATANANASASIQSQKRAEVGVIQKIYVENFMCHRKLTVDLCRNVNFIYGQNGSGKSAVLAAIQICLGAGARRTHRARNLKDLVRKDGGQAAACAKIRVTLLNGGEDGYCREIYGDTITVERTIHTRGGYNGYKLFDFNMKEKSRSKKDLDDMLDKLNIQVENPVAILDQEEAKKFLTGKAEDKYTFFMKATELERIDRTYSSAVDKVCDLEKQLERMMNNMQGDEALLQETKRKWEQHMAIEKLKSKKAALEEAFAWSIYNETKQSLEKEIQNNEMFREKARRKEEKLTQAEAGTQTTDDEQVALRNRLDELTKEAEDQAKLKHDQEKEVKKAVEPQKNLERQMKVVKTDLTKASKELNAANQRLQEKRDEIVAKAGSAESEEAQRAKKLTELEEELSSKQAQLDELKQAVSDAFTAHELVEPKVREARDRVQHAKEEVNRLENKIKGLQSSTGTSLAIFGQRCASMQKLVDQSNSRFHGPVIGPIGSFLKIIPGKEKFAKLAEGAIGNGVLDRWIVCNDRDRKLFQSLRAKAGCISDCGVFQVHEHPRYEIPGPPVEGVETAASVLRIENDLVFNTLVDNCKVDVRALAQSREESERLLLTKTGNGRSAIRGKIKQVFFMPKGDSWQVNEGELNMISGPKSLKQSLGLDRSAALRAAKQDVAEMNEEIRPLREEEGRLELEHHELVKDWNVKKKSMGALHKEIRDLKIAIDDIKNENETAATFDTDTSAQEDEVAEAQQVLQQLKEKEVSLKDQILERQPEIDELKGRLAETTARNEKVLSDLQEAEVTLGRFLQSLTQREEKIEREREKLRQFRDIICKQDEKVKGIEEDLAIHLHDARYLAFRRIKKQEHEESQDSEETVDASQFTQEPTDEDLGSIEIQIVDSTPDQLERKIKKVAARIELEKKNRNATKEDAAAAYAKYVRAKQAVEGKQKKIDQINATSSDLQTDMRLRKYRWRQFRDHIAETSDTRFDEILNRKGSSGAIEYDHKNGLLNLVVQKDSNDANSQQKDVKALSGGERSYTTIALLLALGESLETPFRVLDEFDVFLDPVTRKLTIEALIQMAKGLPHRQFIFITPQDVSNVETGPNLKVLKMKNPDRNAVAGGPTQQTLDFSQP